ncbi:hypothetical protein [Nocardiopsis lucentensis]|uniref:hypothetical protein n=1 Tax=Nocardiopsis lucentensis TaxID=53441 RepID=UPI0003459102|nr:hypothetical protein [Nocardiopsis lucentensis]
MHRSAAGEQFLSDHLAHGRHHTESHPLHHLVDRLRGDTDKDVFPRGRSAGRRPGGALPEIAAIIERHARTCVILDGFHRKLLRESRQTPFPTAEPNRAAVAEAARG